MPPPVLFYMDDSGTRILDRDRTQFDRNAPDHFALGGVLLLEEEEEQLEQQHARLCEKWKIEYPLHSVDIRAGSKKFSWVRKESAEYKPFMRDLTRMLTTVPVLGLACVMDRPGYDVRYREQYPRKTWHLCKTAFSISVERAAKYARSLGRPLRVYPEKSNGKDEGRLKSYYIDLITKGAPFDAKRSDGYAPLRAHELDETLIELRPKGKSSPAMQVADLYLWPIARQRYGKELPPYNALKQSGRLIESRLRECDIPTLGTKYSCFELVDGEG
jgi:hypothetical protein